MQTGSFVYGISEFERRRGDFPELSTLNMFAEQIPTEPGITLQSRPGQVASTITMGSGPVRGLFQIDGVLNNGLFGVSDGSLYNGATLIGAIEGDDEVSFAGYEDLLFINAGTKIYQYDGTTLSEVTFPDNADVCKIVVGASRLIAVRKDTGKLYWSGVLNSTVDALNFASAENNPDFIEDLLYLGDRAIVFGSETVEFWPATGDSDLPFAPLPGATWQIGCKGAGLAKHFDRTFAWITQYNEVCISDPKNIISDPQLQIEIAQASSVSLFTFFVDDNEYLAVRLPTETWVFGARTQVWSKLTTYDKSNWVCQSFENGYFGTDQDGVLLQWSNDAHQDVAGPIERKFDAWISLTGNPLWLGNVQLRTNPGNTPFLTGDNSNPVVELRTSFDGGRTWLPWKEQFMGIQGQYRAKTVWTSLGQFGYPGVLVQIRNTSNTPFRVSNLTYNEPLGGI